MTLLGKRRRYLPNPVQPDQLVFNLPSHNICTKYVKQWAKERDIEKRITPKSGRLGKSIMLRDKNADLATVAAELGQKTTLHVHETHKRHRAKDQTALLDLMPTPDALPNYLEPRPDPVPLEGRQV